MNVLATPAKGRGLLGRVKSGRIDVPDRIFLYGVEGVGKSTFAASAPSPIFIGAEDGTAQLDVTRMPEAKSWQDIVDGVQELISETHDYRTLVIDTVDWLEPVIWDLLCKNDKVDSIEKVSKGYGKGYVAAADIWRSFLTKLDELRHKKLMGIVLLGHSKVKPFKNPSGEDYDQWMPKLHQLSSALLSEWCDSLLFTNWTTVVAPKAGDDKARTFGISDGTRVMYTERRAPWSAKNRHRLPFELPLSWQAYDEAVKGRQPSAILVSIRDYADQLMNADTTKKIEEAIVNAKGDVDSLVMIQNRCRELVNEGRKDGVTP